MSHFHRNYNFLLMDKPYILSVLGIGRMESGRLMDPIGAVDVPSELPEEDDRFPDGSTLHPQSID